jgi:hypothetical protein
MFLKNTELMDILSGKSDFSEKINDKKEIANKEIERLR